MIVLLHVAACAIGAGEYITTPEAFGARGDGKANDWQPIQRALASCAGHAACHIKFANSYLSGPLRINSSGVTLDVAGSLAMLPKRLYPKSPAWPFISNEPAISNLHITGGGHISGGASWAPDSWWLCARPIPLPDCWRPHLIALASVDGLRIDEIALQDPPNHHLEVSDCVGVRLDRLRMDAPHLSPNTDGVNFYGGRDQSLTNSRISNGDDCVSVVPVGENLPVCVGSPSLPACRGGNVVVHNVTCIGGHGLSIGGVRHGTVTNVTFRNITATGGPGNTQDKYATGGLRVKARPNSTGSVRDILYDDILLDDVYLPLQLLGHYCPWPCHNPDAPHSVTYSNITFANIRGSGRKQLQAAFDCR
jgi:polygalacturonase